MPYTRRSVLRDAALVSLAGAAASPPLALLGCRKEKPRPAAAPPAFSGVRVFFIGAWLFCSDGNGAMYAIARDMCDSSGVGTHKFPFGRWRPPLGTKPDFDNSMPLLLPNPTKDNYKHPKPYMISIYPAPTSGSSLSSVFQDAQTNVSFAYLNNPQDSATKDFLLKLDTTGACVRMISLPIPTRIRAAGYLKEATIMDTSANSLLHPPQPGASPKSVSYLPTTHIFDYANASRLIFTAGSVTDTIYSSDAFIDYHFHTVPLIAGDHGPGMFLNLTSLLSYKAAQLTSNDLSLTGTCPPNFDAGPNIPDGGVPELDFDPKATLVCSPITTKSQPNLFNSDLASCSGPGFGVDGEPCSC